MVAVSGMADQNDPTADELLVAQAIAGSSAAFEQLVERHQRKIFRVARAIVRDDGEADTITQDTFVQAYLHLARFESRSSFETWLTRIAINRSRDTLRRRRFVSLFRSGDEEGDETLTMIEPVDERPDPEREMHSSQLRRAIQRAERHLSAQQQVIFRLRHHEDLSLEEIARHLGLRAGTVRAHLFRAIHKIRKELSEWRGQTSREGKHEPALQ